MYRRRPFSVTLLLWLVLSLSAWGAVRLIAALRWWNVLNEFEAGGYLTSHGEIVQGRERKVYTLTAKGREAFQTAVAAWLDATRCIIASKAAAEAFVRSGSEAKCRCD